MTAGVGLSASSIASTAAPMIRVLPEARKTMTTERVGQWYLGFADGSQWEARFD